ncbi:transcription initiation factor TFIID subunit 8-like [Apium graveolens]|uniref:transcription initiation factor TFIID subunit 8-like n=1 Tax=Apium graveolens TaxID=4045 RepID=UPI003D796511
MVVAENGKEVVERSNRLNRFSRNEEFVEAIAKMAVAQVCESSGFQGFQQSALDTLSDIAIRYMNQIGKIAVSNANLSGRNECNVFDVLQGLEDLGMSQGFSGASEIDRGVEGSGIVREISEYVEFSERVPFAYSIPSFPVVKEMKVTESFFKSGGSPPDEHIPTWLPVFPDSETYRSLPVESKGVGDGEMDKSGHIENSKKVEASVSYTHRLLNCNGTDMPADKGNDSSSKRATDSNPFLAAPRRSSEKQVSSVVLPAKFAEEDTALNNPAATNQVAVLEAFASATDLVKDCAFDSEETRKKALPDNRPAVQFKLRTSKNLVGTSISIHKEQVPNSPSSIKNENMKDDRKRRAEQILKESLENQHELAQL